MLAELKAWAADWGSNEEIELATAVAALVAELLEVYTLSVNSLKEKLGQYSRK